MGWVHIFFISSILKKLYFQAKSKQRLRQSNHVTCQILTCNFLCLQHIPLFFLINPTHPFTPKGFFFFKKKSSFFHLFFWQNFVNATASVSVSTMAFWPLCVWFLLVWLCFKLHYIPLLQNKEDNNGSGIPGNERSKARIQQDTHMEFVGIVQSL